MSAHVRALWSWRILRIIEWSLFLLGVACAEREATLLSILSLTWVDLTATIATKLSLGPFPSFLAARATESSLAEDAERDSQKWSAYYAAADDDQGSDDPHAS